MAFGTASVKTNQTQFANKRVTYGTLKITNSETGGDITTGLSNCEFIILSSPAVVTGNPTFSGGTATIAVTNPGADAYCQWIAIGT